MMPKKIGYLAFSILCLVMVLVGCNNESSGDGDSNNENGEKVTLTMNAWGNPAEIKVYQKALDSFMEENPNIKVNLVPIPGDQYEQKLLTQLQGSKGPDLFYSYETTMSKLIAAERVAPLKDFLDNSSESYVKANAFPEGLWGPAEKDGEYYGVTPDANPMVLYYNKNVFEEAGVKTPQEYYDEGNWNWDSFKEVTSQLKSAGKQGFIMENWWAHWYGWVWSNGGSIWNENGEFVLAENNEAREAIQFMSDLVKDGNAVYAGSLPKGQGSDAMFMSNQVGMLAAGRWLEPLFNENKNLDFDYIYWPSNTGQNEPVGIPVAYLAVNKNSKHVEEAKKVLSYYVGLQGQEARLVDGGNALASLPDADSAVMENATIEHSNFFTEARDNGYTHGSKLTFDAQYPGLTKEIEEPFDLMFLGKESPEDTIDTIVKNVNEFLANYKE